MSCAAAVISVSSCGAGAGAPARPFEQAHARGGGEVQRLGGARVRHAHRRVGQAERPRAGSPCASLPNTNATGRCTSVAYRDSSRRRVHREDPEPRAAQPLDRLGRRDPPDDRHVEERPRRRADRLRVVDVDRRGREDDTRRPGGVGRPEDRARVPGIAHLVQDRDAPVAGSVFERHVHEGRDTDDPLRGHRRGQPRQHRGRGMHDVDPLLLGPDREFVQIVVHEQPLDRRRRARRAPHGPPARPRRGTGWSARGYARFLRRAASATLGFLALEITRPSGLRTLGA